MYNSFILLSSINYSGQGVPNPDPEQAGTMCAKDQGVEAWEILNLLNQVFDYKIEVLFYLDMCGAGGAYYQA